MNKYTSINQNRKYKNNQSLYSYLAELVDNGYDSYKIIGQQKDVILVNSENPNMQVNVHDKIGKEFVKAYLGEVNFDYTKQFV